MPQFKPGESKTAKVTMRNPTEKAFDYAGFIYMGTDLAVMSEVPFSLNAGQEKQVPFPVTMPAAPGTYPVHIGVFSGGQNIALYRAVEDVVIVLSAFTYQVTAAYLCTLPQASAWKTPGLSCRIINPSNQPVSRLVTLRIAKVSGAAFDFFESYTIPIPAGGYADWYFDNNRPGMPGYYKTCIGGDGVVDIWLEDEAGGKSTVYRLPGQVFGAPFCSYLV